MSLPRTALGRPTLIAFALVIALGAPDAEAQRKKRAARAPAVSAECTDFYTATNADWLKKNSVPADAGSVSVLGAFRERTLEQQRALLDNAMPFGGMKQSGFGRELGRAVIDQYTESKSVMMNYA